MATYTYNGRNQTAATVVENVLFTASSSYDTAGPLTGVTNGALDSTGYTLSPDGRRTGINRNGQAETYGYDPARQVTSAAYPDLTTTQSWNYDAAGNRTSSQISNSQISNSQISNQTTTYLANLVNEYTSITGAPAPPMCDANGNAISYPVKPLGSSSLVSCVLSWDINNQLIAPSNGAGDSATYQYDALVRRTKLINTVNSVNTVTYFFTNGWNVELEYEGGTGVSPVLKKRQTWGLDLSQTPQGAGGVGGLVMVEQLITNNSITSNPFFPTYDGNGNITAWVDVSGTVIARQRYDAYGNIIEQTGTAPSNYGFSTKPQDQVTGLLYYGYRYYDPVTGRWPSRDPIEEKGGLNLYGFVGNDGVGKCDILGMHPAYAIVSGIFALIVDLIIVRIRDCPNGSLTEHECEACIIGWAHAGDLAIGATAITGIVTCLATPFPFSLACGIVLMEVTKRFSVSLGNAVKDTDCPKCPDPLG